MFGTAAPCVYRFYHLPENPCLPEFVLLQQELRAVSRQRQDYVYRRLCQQLRDSLLVKNDRIVSVGVERDNFDVIASALDFLSIQKRVHGCAIGIDYCIILNGAEDFVGEFFGVVVACTPRPEEPCIIVAKRDFSYCGNIILHFLCHNGSNYISRDREQSKEKNYASQDSAVGLCNEQVKTNTAYDRTNTIKGHEKCVSIRHCVSKSKYKEKY